MAGAAGGFLTRAFELMLKECSGKKYPSLQKSIQTYLDATKVVNQQSTTSKEPNQVAKPPSTGDGSDADAGAAKNGAEPESLQPKVVESENDVGKPSVSVGGTVTAALANAGNSLEGAEADLVLSPLRLAFETKNLKVMEPALDCLHKLIAYDHLEGDPGLDGGKNVPLFTDILNMVCSSVDNSSPDSTILQVLKVLLTAVASTKFRAEHALGH